MAFDPTTLFPGSAGDREGAILKIRPENLWQDHAGTVAVTTDGDPVNRIDDISVNGRNFISYDTGSPMVYHTDGTAHWLTFDGDNFAGFKSSDSWSFMDNNPYSVGVAVKYLSATKSNDYFFGTEPTSGGADDDSVVHLGKRNDTTATIGHWFNDQDFSHTFTTNAERHICEYKNPGSEYTIDGAQVDVSSTTPSALDQVNFATVGIREPLSSGHVEMEGDIYGMIIVVDTITAQEKSDMDGWLQEQIEGPSDQTADIGLVTETTTTSAVTLDRALDVGRVTETNAVFAVEAPQALDLGLVAETNAVFAVEAPQTLDVGLVAETNAVFAMTIAGQPIIANIGLVAETNAVFAVEAPQALDLGLVTETNAVFTLFSGRVLDVGQVTETDSVFAVSVDAVTTAVLGVVEESNRAFRFDSGLTPFWWAFYDQATAGAKAAKRRLRPLVFTDRVTGTNYIIRLNESTLLELQSHSPVDPFLDELFPAFQEPTMKVGKHTIRLFVSNGALGYEHYPFHVRKRPILFGRKIRPTAKNPTYMLTLDESVLDEDT